MGRNLEMKQYLLPFQTKWLKEKIDLTQIKPPGIVDSLIPLLRNLMESEIRQQEKEDRKAVSYLSIYYLKSSILTGSHEYQVTLTDDTWYLDGNAQVTYWYPECVYPDFEQEAVRAQKQIQKRFIRVTQYEQLYVRQLVSQVYQKLTEIYLSEIAEQIQQTEEFQKMRKTDEFRCLYGEYMGKVRTVFQYKGGN